MRQAITAARSSGVFSRRLRTAGAGAAVSPIATLAPALLVIGGRQRHADDLGVVARDDVAVRERRKRPQDGAVDVSPAVGAAAPGAGWASAGAFRSTSSYPAGVKRAMTSSPVSTEMNARPWCCTRCEIAQRSSSTRRSLDHSRSPVVASTPRRLREREAGRRHRRRRRAGHRPPQQDEPGGETNDVRFVKDGVAGALRTLRAATSPEQDDRVGALSAQLIGLRFTAATRTASVEGRVTAHSGRVGLASDLTSRGASTTDVMLAGNWKTSRMVAHYSAGATAERGAVARYPVGIKKGAVHGQAGRESPPQLVAWSWLQATSCQ